MRTVDPEKYAARRGSILEAAATVFAEHGFDNATTVAICRAAGIGSGTLFHYFPDKRAIFHALFADDATQVRRFVDELDRTDPLAALFRLVDRLCADAADPLVPGLMFAAISQAGRDPEFAELVGEADDLTRRTMAELLRESAARGQTDPDLEPPRAARWIQSLVDALYLQCGEPGFDAAADTAMLRIVVRRFLGAATAARAGAGLSSAAQ